MHRAFPQLIARHALAGVFGLALASKLRDPAGLTEPLRLGLGLDATAAGLLFVLVVCVLAACIGALVLWRTRAGLLLAGGFFVCGAAYAVLLQTRGWTGSCGCGVATVADSSNPLIRHAYQNAACAALCLFLGFRAKPEGDISHGETQLKA